MQVRLLLCLLVFTASCAVAVEPEQEFVANEEELTTKIPIGGHLPGIGDEEFAEVSATFAAVETPDDGVGPVFNATSCGVCHSLGALGGAGNGRVRRYGYYDGGDDVFDPLAQFGGSLRQLKTLGDWKNAQGQWCSVPLEVEPQQATVRNVGRLATPLFGLGLVDAMPDEFFVNVANNQPNWVRGKVNWVNVEHPDPSDPRQEIGSLRVGRFGWKAGVSTLVQFSADAYLNEMGITTQSCFKGQSIETFATEPAPNGIPIDPQCEDGLPGVDDAVGPCDNGLTEVQEDVEEFTKFMTFLAPPAQKRVTGSANIRSCNSGKQLFEQVGCSDCHLSTAFVTPRRPFNGVPGRYKFWPYSDFLVHNMGSLGDQIGNLGDNYDTTLMMRTAPLWGIRYRQTFLHDGRANNVSDAILAHDGQGARSRKLFSKLSLYNKQALIKFVQSL